MTRNSVVAAIDLLRSGFCESVGCGWVVSRRKDCTAAYLWQLVARRADQRVVSD
jgi:hypothetical protein